MLHCLLGAREHAGGRARFGNLRPGSKDEKYKLKITAAGYRDELLEGLSVSIGQETDLGIIALDSVPLVRVTVLDDATGAPVQGARVVLSQRDESDAMGGGVMRRTFEIDVDDDHGSSMQLGDGESRTAQTDEEGVALISSFQGESCQLQVTHRAHAGDVAAEREYLTATAPG